MRRILALPRLSAAEFWVLRAKRTSGAEIEYGGHGVFFPECTHFLVKWMALREAGEAFRCPPKCRRILRRKRENHLSTGDGLPLGRGGVTFLAARPPGAILAEKERFEIRFA